MTVYPVCYTVCKIPGWQITDDSTKGEFPCSVSNAAKKSKENHIDGIKEKTLAILMEEYIATLFRLVTSDRDKETIISCMEMIGRVYETGITNLMKKER